MTQLFTDTSANLPVEIIDENGIEVVPFSYTIDGVEYIPEREFDGKAFYAAMRAGSEVKTSMVNAGTFIERGKGRAVYRHVRRHKRHGKRRAHGKAGA